MVYKAGYLLSILNQARAVEQYYIENGTNELNKINSISPDNKYYRDAMNWVKQYLGAK